MPALDMRYALRQLRKAPGFTFISVVTLALGIGVSATVGSTVRQVLLAPLPYAHPERLVGVAFNLPQATADATETGASGQFIARNSRSFASTALVEGFARTANLSSDGAHPATIHVLGVSAGYFPTLAAKPMLGLGFSAAEDRLGAAVSLVISYGLWQRSFAADPSIIGHTVHLDQRDVTIVGVMPRDFRAESSSLAGELQIPDAWRPLQLSAADPGFEGDNYFMYARLRDGVTLDQARGELAVLQPAMMRAYPGYLRWRNAAGQTPVFSIAPLASVISGDIKPSLLVMSGATLMALLLTCLNLVGLNTSRALARSPEFALRAALGASSLQLLRTVLMESAILVGLGGSCALLLTTTLQPLLLHAAPVAIPQLNGMPSAMVIMALVSVLAVLCGVVFVFPYSVLVLRRKAVALAPKRDSTLPVASQTRAAQVLLALQISLAVVLLSSASLLLGTFLKLRSQPTGIAVPKLVVFDTYLKGERYNATQATSRYVEQVVAHLQQSPGVRSVSAAYGPPFQRGLNIGAHADAQVQLGRSIEFRAVAPAYFHTLGLPLLAGRDLSTDDRATAPSVVVVSAAAAKRFWPHGSTLGQTLTIGRAKTPSLVVGVVSDASDLSLAEAPQLVVYGPVSQEPDDLSKATNGWFPVSFVMRVAGPFDYQSIARKAAAAADPEIPVAKIATMQQLLDASTAYPGFLAFIAQGFAGFSVALTAIGLFGLLSYQVTQRTREIGIRMALGATRTRLLSSVLLSSMWIALVGCTLGAVASGLAHPLLARWLEGDVLGMENGSPTLLASLPLTLTVAIATLTVTALVAAALPAHRAANLEPTEALRAE